METLKYFKKVIILLVVLFSTKVIAQQDAQYTQYMYNMNLLNPGYVTTHDGINVGLLARSQWVGIKGAPQTQTLNVYGQVIDGLGVGVSAIHDAIGPLEESDIYLDIAYALPVSEKGKISLGMKGGFSMLNVGLFSTQPVDQDNLQQDYKKNYGNIGFGLYYFTDKFYLGVSAPEILETYKYEVSSNVIDDVSDKMHFFGTAGLVMEMSSSIKLKPSLMVKMVKGAPLSVDLNTSVYFNDKFEIGLSFREGDSLDGIIGFMPNDNWRVGYAYDHTLTNLSEFNSGSHELMLQYHFGGSHSKGGNSKSVSPRYF